MLQLDGSFGEGGGQILRTALGLSLVTGVPFRIDRIRARRRNPGLQQQHLTAVLAAARVGNAYVTGAERGSQVLEFQPERVRGGSYEFDIGTAGSTTLVLQTVLPALMVAESPTSLVLEGGTHNQMAPTFDFLRLSFAPVLARIGPTLSLELDRPGFHPRGGGRMRARIQPAPLKPLELIERGAELERRARACIAGLPHHIARRELDVVRSSRLVPENGLRVEEVQGSLSPGNFLSIELEFENVTEVITGFGQIRVAAERVARDAVREARNYLRTDAPVGSHLADQILIPLALAGAGSFRTVMPSEHTRTNASVIGRFLPVRFEMVEEDAGSWRITVLGAKPEDRGSSTATGAC